MAETIEIVRFRLGDPKNREQFLERNKDMEKNFIFKQPGIISRETAIADDGEVLVVLHWEKPENAQASMDKFVAAPDTKSFTSLINMDTFTMTRFGKV